MIRLQCPVCGAEFLLDGGSVRRRATCSYACRKALALPPTRQPPHQAPSLDDRARWLRLAGEEPA